MNRMLARGWMAGALVSFSAAAAEIWIGAAEVSITPDRPVTLAGQFHPRHSKGVLSPCMANVLALESRENGTATDGAILVACDLVVIRPGELQDRFRRLVAPRLPGFDPDKLFLTATHTHSGPVTDQDSYDDYGETLPPNEYIPFLFDRLADAVVRAWDGRRRGAMAWGLGHAVVGQNRRVVYADGTAQMYGKTNRDDFRGFEGYEDHTLDCLFFTDPEGALLATAIALPCPTQAHEGETRVSADIWHDVRGLLRKKHGDDVAVLGFIAPAGDQIPRPMRRQAAEERMARLRGLTRTQEVARRITAAVDETWAAVKSDLRADVPFVHRIDRFDVPGRRVTDAEAEAARKSIAALEGKEKITASDFRRSKWHQAVLDRHAAQDSSEPRHAIEMHVLRLGDVALATNPFELYLDYGIQIQARSAAPQTVLVQLASPASGGVAGTYLPTPRAIAGGGYSAVVESSPVGPEGGQALVEHTVRAIGEMFGKGGKE